MASGLVFTVPLTNSPMVRKMFLYPRAFRSDTFAFIRRRRQNDMLGHVSSPGRTIPRLVIFRFSHRVCLQRPLERRTILPNQSLRCRVESDASPLILRSAAIIACASRFSATHATIFFPRPTIAQLKPSGPSVREGSIFQWFIRPH